MKRDTVHPGPPKASRSAFGLRAVAASMVVAAAALLLPEMAGAQDAPANAVIATPPAAPVVRRSADGYLFRTPRVSLGMRTGFNFARAGSEVFDLATNNLTLRRNDFGSFLVAGDLAINVAGPVDVVLGASYASTSKASEFQEYEDQDGLPITQRTTFTQTPITGMIRAYLLPRGRQIGRFAWVPTKFAPYVAAGGGYAHYLYRQSGSFVDFVDLSIFDDTFESSGWTPVGLVNAGFDYTLHPNVVLNTDARYQFGSGDLDREFVDFTDGLDLNGFQLSMGVRFRF
jgi:hypothetical protein